jgi:hypothetical protein
MAFGFGKLLVRVEAMALRESTFQIKYSSPRAPPVWSRGLTANSHNASLLDVGLRRRTPGLMCRSARIRFGDLGAYQPNQTKEQTNTAGSSAEEN